jgi:hypothetical protein
VEAVDGDKSGSRNSRISYEIINGNYDKKFSIDKDTGRLWFVKLIEEMLYKRILKEKKHTFISKIWKNLKVLEST